MYFLYTAKNEEFGEDWPLEDDRIRQLDINQEFLINTIESCESDLICKLLAEKVISEMQYSFISEERNSISKNEALLSILRRGSVRDYNKTIDCLNKSGQEHIAKILQDNGGRLNGIT